MFMVVIVLYNYHSSHSWYQSSNDVLKSYRWSSAAMKRRSARFFFRLQLIFYYKINYTIYTFFLAVSDFVLVHSNGLGNCTGSWNALEAASITVFQHDFHSFSTEGISMPVPDYFSQNSPSLPLPVCYLHPGISPAQDDWFKEIQWSSGIFPPYQNDNGSRQTFLRCWYSTKEVPR